MDDKPKHQPGRMTEEERRIRNDIIAIARAARARKLADVKDKAEALGILVRRGFLKELQDGSVEAVLPIPVRKADARLIMSIDRMCQRGAKIRQFDTDHNPWRTTD